MHHFLKRLFITLCLITGSTGLATRALGAAFFLPALFVRRYSTMGGLEQEEFSRELSGVRSFGEKGWCDYWDALASRHAADAERTLLELAGPSVTLSSYDQAALAPLWQVLEPVRPVVAGLLTQEVGAQGQQGLSLQQRQAFATVHSLMKAIAYYQVSAFPCASPRRMQAYQKSRELFDLLIEICAPVLGVSVERMSISTCGENVEGYLVLPSGSGALPLVLATNGLEGTVQELALPLLKCCDRGMAVFVMEMPGTYAYKTPMSGESEQIYHGVIEHMLAHPRIDASRVGMLGVSFGAYWSTRMALASERLRCVVANGGPNYRTFRPAGSFGSPEIIVRALIATTGAKGLHDVGGRLGALSLHTRYRDIKTPLLLINGEKDTLVSTQDSIDISTHAPKALLKLYPDDDHCAMAHSQEWVDLSLEWMGMHLQVDENPPS
ncbi:alpha/beta hydrolase family protein [Pseudomonas paralcaligenes]|uniref:alpha/beta hydrolase family protein n=1 Tax=Pseudomonas paralcaligenes TaxID=2772558 RepID=UPI001C81EB51|nr:alpha/beta hydrolase [Pseudomonas paralcaligenes]